MAKSTMSATGSPWCATILSIVAAIKSIDAAALPFANGQAKNV